MVRRVRQWVQTEGAFGGQADARSTSTCAAARRGAYSYAPVGQVLVGSTCNPPPVSLLSRSSLAEEAGAEADVDVQDVARAGQSFRVSGDWPTLTKFSYVDFLKLVSFMPFYELLTLNEYCTCDASN